MTIQLLDGGGSPLKFITSLKQNAQMYEMLNNTLGQPMEKWKEIVVG